MHRRIPETTLRTLFCALLLLSTLAPPLAPAALAQGAQDQPRDETFEEVADVIEVQIPVNVATRDGAPVRGLTADDFEIFDRGDRQPLSGFDVVDLEVLQPDFLMGPSAIDAAIPAAARRHFLLLFDLTFASPASVTKARNAAQDFVLHELHPTDLVAAATYSLDTGPRLLVTFTPDRAQLARAIDTLGAPRLLDREGNIDPLRFMIEQPNRAGMSGTIGESEPGQGKFAGLIEQEVQAYVQVINRHINRMEKSYLRGRVSSWVSGLDEMAQLLGSIDGRKHVVFFTEGFDGRLMLGRGADANDPAAQEDRNNLQFGNYWDVDPDDIYGNTALYRQVYDALEEFRRADCVIQAVDISGLGSDSSEDRRARSTGQDALFYMANETGGALFENTNDLGAELNQVLERSTVTYLLSFQPQNLEYNGEYHRIEVRLKGEQRRGTDVSHRAGYFAPRPFEDLHPLEKSLLASDAIASAAPRRDLDVDVLVAPFRAGAESAYVPVIIEVGGRKLVSGHEKGSLSAEFYAYVSDDQGQMRDFFSQLVSLDLSDEGRENMSQAGLKYYGHLNLTAGDYLVRVLVRNASTGRTGIQSIRVSVPDYTADSPQLLPPFFIEPSNRWFLVREQRPTQQDSVVYPFTVNGSPYIPSARPVIVQGEESELVLVAYNLEDGAINLRGTVVGPNGDERAAEGLELVERTVTGIGGLDKLLARFQVGDLASGSYTLQVAVEQPGAGKTHYNSIPFSVRR
jgi:VWFA-related protein